MSTLTLARPGPPGRGADRPAPSLFDGVGGEPTLDEILAGAWAGLAAHRSVSCPVCGEQMNPAYGTQALQSDDSGAACTGSRMTRARPAQASQDPGRAASSSGRRAGRVPEGGRCGGCETSFS